MENLSSSLILEAARLLAATVQNSRQKPKGRRWNFEDKVCLSLNVAQSPVSFSGHYGCEDSAELRSCCLGKTFFVTKRPWCDSIIQDNVLHRKYGTNGRMEKMGMHNRSEDGCSARVTYFRTLLNLIYNLQLTWPFVGHKQFYVYYISTDFPMCHKCI
jgi:hypothetical protein